MDADDLRAMAAWPVAAAPVGWAAAAGVPARLTVAEAVVCAVAFGMALLLVRRRPVGALGLAALTWLVGFAGRAADDGGTAVAVLGAGLAVVAVLAGRASPDGGRGAPVLAAVAVVATVTGYAVSGGVDTALVGTAGVLVLGVLPWAAGRHLCRRAELAGAGWELAERIERDAAQARATARAEERSRVAADMHDLVGHELAHVALALGAMELDRALDPARRAEAGAARAGVTAAAERLADTVRVLRDGGTREPDDLPALVARARAAGTPVDLDDEGAAGDPVIEAAVRRIVAEALTNAAKHAPGATATVLLRRTVDGTTVRVRTGPGTRPAPAVPGGSGLAALDERVRLLGGRFAAGPDGPGFLAEAVLPPAPSAPRTPARDHHARAREGVHRSAVRTALLAVAVATGLAAAALGYTAFDAATSVLPPAELALLVPGQDARSVESTLPWRTRVDRIDGPEDPPVPSGADCRYYSVDADPFRRDLYRVCLSGGVLVSAERVERVPAG